MQHILLIWFSHKSFPDCPLFQGFHGEHWGPVMINGKGVTLSLCPHSQANETLSSTQTMYRGETRSQCYVLDKPDLDATSKCAVIYEVQPPGTNTHSDWQPPAIG